MQIKPSIKKGFSFGIVSGIITTLGLVVGLYSSTESRIIVMGGVVLIAIADALSDSLGIHISEESENKHSEKEIWQATLSTFFSKFVFALSFIIPLLLFELKLAIIISVFWGFLLIGLFSFYISKQNQDSNYKVVIEHLILTLFVIIVTYYLGRWVSGLGV